MPAEGKSEEDVMELVLDTGVDDISLDEDYFEIQTPVETFESVRKLLVEKDFKVENANLQWIAKNMIEVKGEDAEKVMKLIESLEDIDDVQNVYSNADIVE